MLKDAIWSTVVCTPLIGTVVDPFANATPFSPNTRTGCFVMSTDWGLNGKLYSVPTIPPLTSTAWYGYVSCVPCTTETDHVASTPPLPSGMIFPGYWVSFWVVALSIVELWELSGLICIRYSVSDVTTLFTVLRTSYSRYAVPLRSTHRRATHTRSQLFPKICL